MTSINCTNCIVHNFKGSSCLKKTPFSIKSWLVQCYTQNGEHYINRLMWKGGDTKRKHLTRVPDLSSKDSRLRVEPENNIL